MPTSCPNCGSIDIITAVLGTKAIADVVQKILPKARVARFDSDNKKSESLGELYSQVGSGEFDVLVGTQILAKGLDLPKLASVVVLQAESGLLLPDYRSAERTFQLLYQVLGRVGRGHTAGSAIIQTRSPEHPAIVMAAKQNYQSFYETELLQRQTLGLPPFYFCAVLYLDRKQRQNAEKACLNLKQKIETEHKGVKILGPSPAFIEKSARGYRWHLVLLSKKRESLSKIATNLSSDWVVDLDPDSLL